MGGGRAAGAGLLPTAVPNHGALCAELAKMGFNATQVCICVCACA